jgi:glucose-6-phosphate 1-dehydrogenase
MPHQIDSFRLICTPTGRDLQSCNALSKVLSDQFEEHQLYRIDHYLGKEVVQNLLFWRFSNIFENLWHRSAIQSVIISFKEPFGTEGRGGYFDSFGIIRDVVQNHLLQVLMLIAMEPPLSVDGPQAGEDIRDCKARVLQAMSPVRDCDCLLGQYEGYADDPTIPNKDTNCPTYAALRTYIHTPRWMGVPFILEAGKALNERKCDIRIQFRAPPAAQVMFRQEADQVPTNELVMRLQPNPAIYITSNIKSPGFSNRIQPIQLSMDYSAIASPGSNPDAYTRLILDVLRGRQGSFVRNDELRRSWEIFTPLLHKIENDNLKPATYKCGTEGPVERQAFFQNAGAAAAAHPGDLDAPPKLLAKL